MNSSISVFKKCGTPLEPFAEGLSQGMECPACGWGFATTHFEAMELTGLPLPCPQCPGWMYGAVSGGSITYTCQACGLSCLTSHLPEVLKDKNRYLVGVDQIDCRNGDHVRLLSKLLKENSVGTWRRLKMQQRYEFEYDAIRAIRVVDMLKKSGVQYTVSPELKFSMADLVKINGQEFQ